MLALPLKPALESQILTEQVYPKFLLTATQSSFLAVSQRRLRDECPSGETQGRDSAGDLSADLRGPKDPEFKGCCAQETSQGQDSSRLCSVTPPHRRDALKPLQLLNSLRFVVKKPSYGHPCSA